MLKNLSNRPPLVNVTGLNVEELRRSGRLLKTFCIDYNKGRISKGKGKLKKKENNNKEYNQFNNL